jgi:uncharacterized protein (DUF952 family)
VSRSGLDWRADFQHGGQLDQLRFVLVGVVLAEQEFTARWKLCPYTSGGAAAVAAVSPCEFWTDERCGHGVLLSRRRFSTLTDAFRIGVVPQPRAGVSCLTFLIGRGQWMVTRMTLLLHICSPADWAEAQRRGEHRPDSLRDVGFVHLSTPEQVHLPANRLYAGRTDLLLLHLDAARLDAPVRWEPGDTSDPTSMLFPHLYGPVPVNAVVTTTAYRPGPGGTFEPVQPSAT